MLINHRRQLITSELLKSLAAYAATAPRKFLPNKNAQFITEIEDRRARRGVARVGGGRASSYFCNSKRYPALLQYLVEQTLQGSGDEIKERTVGVEVFGRRPDYDTNLDTIVRYTAGEVRKRLALYHQNSPNAGIQISLTARSYHVEFLRSATGPTADDQLSGKKTTPWRKLLNLPKCRRSRSRFPGKRIFSRGAC